MARRQALKQDFGWGTKQFIRREAPAKIGTLRWGANFSFLFFTYRIIDFKGILIEGGELTIFGEALRWDEALRGGGALG